MFFFRTQDSRRQESDRLQAEDGARLAFGRLGRGGFGQGNVALQTRPQLGQPRANEPGIEFVERGSHQELSGQLVG